MSTPNKTVHELASINVIGNNDFLLVDNNVSGTFISKNIKGQNLLNQISSNTISIIETTIQPQISDINNTITIIENDLNGKANINGQIFSGNIYATNLSGENTGNETQITILQKLGNTGVTAGNYTNTNIQVDQYGRLISASNGSVSLDHATLTHLDFANSGHTGFQPYTANISAFNNDVGYLIVETDPIFVASNAHNITLHDIQTLANTSNINSGDQDLTPYLTISNAISQYVPYNGANSDIDIGSHNLTGNTLYINHIQVSNVATPITNREGLLQWNPVDGTLDLGMQNGNITQQIGQELFIKVINKSGLAIDNGVPVRFNGRQGNRPKIVLAQGNSDVNGMVMGITTENIPDNSEGYITTFGYVRQIKTDYSGAGDWGTTWAEGDKLWVSKTIAGQLTNIEPVVPHHSDIIGCVGIVGGTGIGSILVHFDRHKSLDELSDVDGTPLTTNGQILVWNNSNSYFDPNYNINDYITSSNVSSNYVKSEGLNIPATVTLQDNMLAVNVSGSTYYIQLYK